MTSKPKVKAKSIVELDEVTEAEILWCLQAVVKHFSLSGAGSCTDVFKRMFKKCSTAQDMTLKKDKMGYVITYGLGPHFRQKLFDDIHPDHPFSVSYDESLNKISQKCQMDVMLTFWSKSKEETCTMYVGSAFLGHTTAAELLKGLKSVVNLDEMKRMINLAMDGPNVNWKMYRDLLAELKVLFLVELISIGSCGLHTTHNSFKQCFTILG